MSDDDDTIRGLRGAMATAVRDHHLDPLVGERALAQVDRPGGPPRSRRREYLAAAACVATVAAAALGYAAWPRPGTGPAAAGAGCRGAVVTSALPVWARDGFAPDSAVNPHVTGAKGQIVGVLFTDPLRSPPTVGHNNKILWVARDRSGSGDLVIRAQLQGTDRVVTRSVPGGPGPSIVDLPAPGCWHLTLTWNGRRDTLSVPYAPG